MWLAQSVHAMLNKGKILLTPMTEKRILILHTSTYTRKYKLMVTYPYTMYQPELITSCRVIHRLEYTLLKDYSSARMLDNSGLPSELLTLTKASYFALHELLIWVKHACEDGKYAQHLRHKIWTNWNCFIFPTITLFLINFFFFNLLHSFIVLMAVTSSHFYLSKVFYTFLYLLRSSFLLLFEISSNQIFHHVTCFSVFPYLFPFCPICKFALLKSPFSH